MLQKSLEKAKKYLGRLGEIDSTFIVLDVEGTDLIFYSDRQLPGYNPVNGVYAKRVAWSSLNEGEQEKVKGWLSRGPESRGGISDDVFRTSLEINVLSVRSMESKGLEKYCFIPTKEATERILSQDERYADDLEALMNSGIYDYPVDVLAVHEGLHGGIGFYLRFDLFRELRERNYIGEDDYPVARELFSQLGEMRYIRENYPELVGDRREKLRMDMEAFDAYTKRSEEAKGLLGPEDISEIESSPHGPAAVAYFQIEQNPDVWCFANLLFCEPYEGPPIEMQGQS